MTNSFLQKKNVRDTTHRTSSTRLILNRDAPFRDRVHDVAFLSSIFRSKATGRAKQKNGIERLKLVRPTVTIPFSSAHFVLLPDEVSADGFLPGRSL
jgi:hypothetical protein